MEAELKLPYAERYDIDYPSKKLSKKEMEEYVQSRLTELHPGFGEKSLWDYTVLKNGGQKTVLAAVLERDFYIEKRLSDRKTRFFINGEDNKKYYLFETSEFDEKGEKRRSRFILPAVIFLIFILIILLAVQINRMSRKNMVFEETVEKETVEDAVNVFDALNQCASIIAAVGGKITAVSFSSGGKEVVSFSVTGCEPYSLVREVLALENTAGCECEDIVYAEGKETFELKVELKKAPVRQRIPDELELLDLQKYITELLKESGVEMVTAGTESSSGRLSFRFECKKEKVSQTNKVMNVSCVSNNLFPLSFSEVLLRDGNGIAFTCEMIILDESQRIKAGSEDEKLSSIFDFTEKKKVSVYVQKENITTVTMKNSEGWKKIGSEVKDGKVIYYYRTAEGKIEVTEENYE